MRLRDDHAFEQRKATVAAILDDLGPIRDEDSGKRDEVRRFEIALDAPEPQLVVRARFRYLEWWNRDGRGWRLAKYQYDYIDLIEGSRLAYHRHDLPGDANRPHAHCKPPDRPPRTSHYRAYEVDLLEAHEEFVSLYSSGRPVNCAGLRPLRDTGEGADV